MTHDFGGLRIETTPTPHKDCYRLDLKDASGDILHTSVYTSNSKGAPEQWDDEQWNGLLDTMQGLRGTQ